MCVVVFSNADTRHAIKKRKVFLFFVFFCCGNERDSTANLVVTHRSRGTLFVGFHKWPVGHAVSKRTLCRASLPTFVRCIPTVQRTYLACNLSGARVRLRASLRA
ncbi:unnamed protein product [Ectocarpus sp. 8 AP-2014]